MSQYQLEVVTSGSETATVESAEDVAALSEEIRLQAAREGVDVKAINVKVICPKHGLSPVTSNLLCSHCLEETYQQWKDEQDDDAQKLLGYLDKRGLPQGAIVARRVA